MTTNTSCRTILADLATAPVAGLPAIAGAVATDDPIFAAISEIKHLEELTCKLTNALEDAEIEAAKTHGRRSWTLISWRNFSMIGGYEIERARDEFLQLLGADPERIDAEYQDAKSREMKAINAERDWYDRTV
jgi:hypothetical protein